MWRLKTSEGGGPWVQTVSGFHGRQVWEFDPNAGTDEERAKVEQLRREFTDNRFRRRESQDLLMRMQVYIHISQVIRQSKFTFKFNFLKFFFVDSCKQLTGLKHPDADMHAGANKLEEGDEVTVEILEESLRRALGWMAALQAEDGHWPGDFSGIMYLLPFWVGLRSPRVQHLHRSFMRN